MTSIPTNFPDEIKYLTHPIPSPLLTKFNIIKFCSPSPFLPPNPPPHTRIITIKDPNHPAYLQSGLFNGNSKKIVKGTWIRDYFGIVHTQVEADEKSDYDLCLEKLDGGEIIGIDATKAGGEARFVNDYRGILERPNAIFELRRWSLGARGEGVRMAIFAGPAGIAKSEEICVSYGKGFWNARTKGG